MSSTTWQSPRPEILMERGMRLLDEWRDSAVAQSATGVDPLDTVLEEGDPWHARWRPEEYDAWLEETGRGLVGRIAWVGLSRFAGSLPATLFPLPRSSSTPQLRSASSCIPRAFAPGPRPRYCLAGSGSAGANVGHLAAGAGLLVLEEVVVGASGRLDDLHPKDAKVDASKSTPSASKVPEQALSWGIDPRSATWPFTLAPRSGPGRVDLQQGLLVRKEGS